MKSVMTTSALETAHRWLDAGIERSLKLERTVSGEGEHAEILMTIKTEIESLYALNAELLACLQECADELAAEVEYHYKGTKDYPSEQRRYERDMGPVVKARAALAKTKQG